MKTIACFAIAAAAAGCDWADAAFLDSIPVEGARADDMYVYIAYDGLAASTVQDAMAQGAFSGPSWRSSKFITDFPGSSDASWTRILRLGRMHGYEFEYYDPSRDKLVDAGLGGLAKHILPNFDQGLSFEPEYLRAFDFRSHGYSHNFEVYSDTWVSLGETLDELFFQLDGRAQTGNVFFAYFLEGDVLGHTGSRAQCAGTLARLAQRIENFRAAHPERKFHFTILSDHGIDFTPMPGKNFLDYAEELQKVGVTPVESLGGRDPSREIYAVPILHVRLMYFALHTHPDLVAEIGRRVSGLESVDLAVGRLGPSRFGLWSGGKLEGTFEHSGGAYLLDGDFSRYGVPAGTTAVSDEELFGLTRDGSHPDLFYRLRTSLSEVGLEYPAEVIVSTKSGWQSAGAIPPPDPAAFIRAGTHGGVNADGIGALLSEERDLPPAVRADAFLDLFPRLADHLRERGLTLRPTDPDALRPRP